jgi:hypothetical protein
MNDDSKTAETGNATAPKAILGLDLDILHAPVPAEACAFITHLAKCAEAVSSVCKNARLPASVSVEITRQLQDDDSEWFEGHPGRAFRYRDPIPGEYLGNICADVPPHFVLVRQVSKGARLLAPLWFEFNGPTTSVERFAAVRNQKRLDSDLVLSTMFDIYCAFPGVPLDIRNLLGVLADRSWLEMVRLFSTEAPAS